MHERQDHPGDHADGDHHIDPSPGIAARGRQHQQRHGVSDTDAQHDRDRASPAEEEGRPQDGPHVEHGAVSGTGRSAQRVGDQDRPDATQWSEPPAGQFRTEHDQQDRDRDRYEHRQDREAGIAGQEALDRPVEGRAAVHGGGGIGHQPFIERSLSNEGLTPSFIGGEALSHKPFSDRKFGRPGSRARAALSVLVALGANGQVVPALPQLEPRRVLGSDHLQRREPKNTRRGGSGESTSSRIAGPVASGSPGRLRTAPSRLKRLARTSS